MEHFGVIVIETNLCTK